MARAEGITEPVGTIDLHCEEPVGLGFGSPDLLEITVELNTRITSAINDDRLVQNLMYTEEDGADVTPVISKCLRMLLLVVKTLRLLALHSRRMAAPSRGRS